MKIEARKIKRLVRNILTTRPDEIGCADCRHLQTKLQLFQTEANVRANHAQRLLG